MRPEILFITDPSHEESASLLRGISRFQAEHQAWRIFVDRECRRELEAERAASRPWGGVISRTTQAGLVEACRACALPLVDLNDCAPFAGVPKVRPDNRAIGHMAAEELHERGFRHLFYSGYTNQLWSAERRDGFFEAIALLGGGAEEFSLLHGCSLAPAENAQAIASLSGWLRTIPRPAGILAAHDLRAYQLLLALEQTGLQVPDEVAVLGVNDDETLCELAFPTLSSIAKDGERIGYLAAQMLSRLMSGGSVAPETLVEPLRVVTRRSTDGLAIDDRAIARALGIIRARACEGLHVSDVTRLCAVSRDRLEKGLRRWLGRSPHAEIRRIQLTRVRDLLATTDLPLKDISAQAGFEYVEYLNVAFKRAYGQTPGRFRRAVRMAGGDATPSAA